MAKQSDKMLQAIKNLITQCAGYDNDEIAEAREKAIDYYLGRPRGDEVPGRSRVISMDVSAMTEAVLSQMLNAFSTDNVVEFTPEGPGDEDQAALESDVVSHFVMESNPGVPGFITLQEAIKDALLLRNGVIKVWVNDKSFTETRTYEFINLEAVSELMGMVQMETGATDVELVNYDEETMTASLKLYHQKRELKVEAVPIENFIYYPHWHTLDLQDIPICGERKIETRSTLIELGYPKKIVEGLPSYIQERTSDSMRNPSRDANRPKSHDASQDMIEYYDLHVRYDSDGDGIAELHRVIYSNDQLLEDEEVKFVPYAAGSALINPHRFLGISLFDKLKQVQDINTGLTRALLDNANANNKSRLIVVNGKVNSDDLNDGRVNGVIRVKDSTEFVKPLTTPDISAGILSNLQHMSSVRAELGGSSLELASGNAQLASQQVGSQGLDRAYSVMEQMAAMMTKNIAETLIRQTYILAHKTLREWFTQPVDVKRGGRWLQATPSQWRPRVRVNIKIGMSAGERSRKVAALAYIIEKQQQISEQMGLTDVLVNVGNYHRALLDWGRASEIDNPETYFMDPESEEAQRTLQMKQQQAEEQRAQQIGLMDQALALEELRTAFNKYKQDTDLQFKYYDANLKYEIEEGKIVGKAAADLAMRKTNGGTDNGVQ